MRSSLFCTPELFLLNTLLYFGQTQESNSAVVAIQPNWPKIYERERIFLKCKMKNGGGAGWKYKWKTSSAIIPPNKKGFWISASVLHSGSYRCAGRNQSDQPSASEWGPAFELKIYFDEPQPVLTVSPSWPSPGASVTLNCGVEHPSAGWSFYWFKAVPKETERSYSYELIRGSAVGAKRDSYIVRGQNHTTGYLCRAGRGGPVYYTKYSEPRFIWSGEFGSTVSLTVSPDREQHFSSESVSLSCEGKSSVWRVMRFTETGLLSHCNDWGTMSGSTCCIHHLQYRDAVYWCESASGGFSNAVNITVHPSRPESSPSLLLLLTAVLSGAALIILLLFLNRFIKSKDPSSDGPKQPQSTRPEEPVNQDEPQEHIYTSPLQGDVCIYETIGGRKDTGNDGRAEEFGDDVTFRSIQLKSTDKKSEHEDPAENSDYYNENPRLTSGP